MDPKKLTQQDVFDVVADLQATEYVLRKQITELENQLWSLRSMRLKLASPVPDEHPPVQPKYPLAYVPPTIPAKAGHHSAGGRYWEVKDAGPIFDRNDLMD